MAFFRRPHTRSPVQARAWVDQDGSSCDWAAIDRSALVARSLGRLCETDDERARGALAAASTSTSTSSSSLCALSALDAVARSGGERVRTALAGGAWPALLARLAAQAGRSGGGGGTPPPPASLASVQLLLDWAAAYAGDALGCAAAAELRALGTAPRGSALAVACLADPTPGAAAAAAVATTADAARPPAPGAPPERGVDFLNGFISLPVTQAVAAAAPPPPPPPPPAAALPPLAALPPPAALPPRPPPALDAPALVARFTAATGHLASLGGALRASLGSGGPPPPLVSEGEAAAAQAAGWARGVAAAVAAGGLSGDPAALSSVLSALDSLNSARQAWAGGLAALAGRARGGSEGGVPHPLPPPPPPPARPSSGGSFWARFDDAAVPAAARTAAAAAAPLAPPLHRRPSPPLSTTTTPAPARTLPPPTIEAAAMAAYARQPALRVRFTPAQFVRLAAGVVERGGSLI